MRAPEDRRVLAHQMTLDHLDKRMTLPQLAQKYDCSPAAAQRLLQYGREHGLYVDRARQLIEAELLPRALAVYEKVLEGQGRQFVSEAGDDLDAARDILFGLGALSKSTTVKHSPSDAADTLDAWRQKYFEEQGQLVIDSTVVQPALPEATQPATSAPERDEQGSAADQVDRSSEPLSQHEPIHFPSGRRTELHGQSHEDSAGLPSERPDAAGTPLSERADRTPRDS